VFVYSLWRVLNKMSGEPVLESRSVTLVDPSKEGVAAS